MAFDLTCFATCSANSRSETSRSLGFRAGPVGYSNDLVDMPEASFAELGGLALWIVDALRDRPHPTHAHVERSLEWVARLKPVKR